MPTASKPGTNFVPSVYSCDILRRVTRQDAHFAGFFTDKKFAVLFRRCFTPKVHTCTDDHAAQSYSSASFKSASSSCHCKNSAIVSLIKLVIALDVSTRRCSQPSHKYFLSNSTLYTPLHTVLSFYISTKPTMLATLLGMPSSI